MLKKAIQTRIIHNLLPPKDKDQDSSSLQEIVKNLKKELEDLKAGFDNKVEEKVIASIGKLDNITFNKATEAISQVVGLKLYIDSQQSE